MQPDEQSKATPQPKTDNSQQPPVPPPVPSQPAPADDVKTFSLRATETQLLTIIRNNQNAIFSAALSTIAVDRLGYKVTGHTQFELDAELTTVKLRELPQDVPVAPAPGQSPNPNEAPSSGAVSAK